MRKPYQVRDASKSTTRPFGSCTHCGNLATKEALFKGDGFLVIEKYCDSCLQTEKFSSIMTFYAMIENPSAK